MTDTNDRDVLDLGPEKSALDRAIAALGIVEQLGGLDDDGRFDALVAGLEVGKAQHAYLRAASAYALVSIAESLERLEHVFTAESRR